MSTDGGHMNGCAVTLGYGNCTCPPQPTSTGPTTERVLGAVNQNTENGCYCGSDADLDRVRDLLRAGWGQREASELVWPRPGDLTRYIDHLADVRAAWELVNQLLDALDNQEEEAA